MDNTNVRYSLLCRALQATPAKDDPLKQVEEPLSQLESLIKKDLLELSKQASPDNFAELFLEFERELHRLREFVAYPTLSSKIVVAFGGAFSAGKSSLINALLDEKLMVVEIDPTTVLPAYVIAGEENSIYALNNHQLRIQLSELEFASLTHDELELYGSQVSRNLNAAFVIRENFPWQGLAFIDTPGYTGQSQAGDRTDEKVAASQLNTAQAIVWAVNAKQGTLPETDVEFLTRLNPDIPKIIVVTRADQVETADLNAIVERISHTLHTRNLPVQGVFPVSSRRKHQDLLVPVKQQLEDWQHLQAPETFAHRFKRLFVHYQRGLVKERQLVQWQRSRLNTLHLLADAEIESLVADLLTVNMESSDELESVTQQLSDLQLSFFTLLKRLGDMVGIALPEPAEMELLDIARSNLLDVLIELRVTEDEPEPDVRLTLDMFRQALTATNKSLLVRQQNTNHRQKLQRLQISEQAKNTYKLIRKISLPIDIIKEINLCAS